ncbi:hypothetical protein LOD99_4648 [Oopsacas minuta]|uniref:Uncharacterized protein n=1 Tax=Oopsacas minuta TaxID=111878 RepID=A0AAV7JTT3_9METZ|nr:hypothetical protein LOD99_4648 [Oopsacas minuta]
MGEPIEGEVHQLVTHLGIRKWRKRYLIVKTSYLMLYEKQEDVNNPNPQLKVSFYEIKEIQEATFIGDQSGQVKRDTNCGFKVDYGGHHSISLQANSQEERTKFVQSLQDKKNFWQQQTPTSPEKTFFGKDSSMELIETCEIDLKDPLGLVGKEEVVQIREEFEGTCSVRLLYSDASIQYATLSSNMTGEEVLEQVQDLSNSSRSSLFLLDTKGVVQNLRPKDKPGPILARLYGLCVVEPQNRVFVVHFPSSDWIPLILNKGVSCQQIIHSQKIKAKISDNQSSNAALFIRKSTEIQSISSHTAGEVQLSHQECPAELLYTETTEGVEPKQTVLILRQGTTGTAVTKTERNRTMTIKDKYALLSSPLSKVKNQRNMEMIYDEAIENLENDPLQSSVMVPKINQEWLEDSDNTPDDNRIRFREKAEEISPIDESVELLPSSEPRGRLPPLHSTSPSKTDGVKKLFNKTFHSKKSAEIQKDDTVQAQELKRGRTTALTISDDDEHMVYVDEANRHKHTDSHPFEMSIEDNFHQSSKHHYIPPSTQNKIVEEPRQQHLVRPSSLAPILTAGEIARHVTSAKTPDEENYPLSPTSITLQEIAKYPTIKTSTWQQVENNSMTERKDDLDKNAIISDLQARANPNIESKPAIGAIKVDTRQPIMIPKIAVTSQETRVFQIISPALLRTWVLNKANNPPSKIQVNKSILEWKKDKWVLAANSQYSDLTLTDENKSIFKLAGGIELVYYDKSKVWSVNGPKIIKYVQPSMELKKNAGPKTNVQRKKMEFTRQAVAQFSNVAGREDELGFNDGDVMNIVSEVSEDWLMCENKEGVRGYVPTNYVKIQDYKPTAVKEEEIQDKLDSEEQNEDAKSESKVLEDNPEGSDKVEIEPEPVIDMYTRLAIQLREKIKLLQNAVDPIIWHSGATRDPEIKKQLFDDRKTPAVAVLIRGKLSTALAEIILKGLKAKKSFFQIENNNIWSVVLETAKYKDSIPACSSAYKAIEDICILSEVTNTLGSPSSKFRSFICQALNNQFLESWLYTVFFDLGGNAFEGLYEIDSFVVCSRHEKIRTLLEEMLLIVQPLDALGFQLSINFERGPQPSEGKWLSSSGIGQRFGNIFLKTMTQPITPLGTKNSSRTSSRENLSINHTMTSLSRSSSPTNENNNKMFVTPGESIKKGNVTVDTATDIAVADSIYTRTIGPKKSIEQLNKIVEDSKIQEDTPDDVNI